MSVPLWICGTCNRVLVLDTRPHRSVLALLAHGPLDPDDHPVVPVVAPEGYAGGRCDFCSGEPPTQELPARGFSVPGTPQAYSPDNWAACAACAELLGRGSWAELLVRVRAAWEDTAGRPMPELVWLSVQALYGRLRVNVIGPLRPIGRRDTP